jgi:hypothetical protein
VEREIKVNVEENLRYAKELCVVIHQIPYQA